MVVGGLKAQKGSDAIGLVACRVAGRVWLNWLGMRIVFLAGFGRRAWPS